MPRKRGDSVEIFKLFGRIMIDDKEAQKSLSKTDKNAQSLGKRFGSMVKTAAKWGAGLVTAAGAAGAALFGLVNKATQTADAIAKGAERVGVSTDFYQEMEFWASQNGLSHEKMEKALGRFNQRLGQAVNGNEKYANALRQLGVNLDDVRNGTITTEDAYAKAIKTLSEMENEQDKVNLATEMFGTRLARDLLPALNEGSLSIEEARQKAQELGLVLSEDQLQAAEAFQDSWDSIKRSLGAAATQIGLDLMPMFQSLLDWVLENLPAIRESFSKVSSGIQTAVGWVVDVISSVISSIQEWREQNEGTLKAIWENIQGVLSTVVDFIKTNLETIYSVIQDVLTNVRHFWEQNGQQILENGKTIFNSVKETVTTVFNVIQTIIQTVLELVVPFIQEKLTVIQQFWADNGEQIMQAVQNAFSFIQSVIEFVMPAIQFVIETVWGIIQGIIDGALNVIMGLLKTFAGLFTGDWKKMWEGIKQFLTGALELIWNLIQLSLLSRVMDVVKSFATAFRSAISAPFNWMKTFINTILDTVTSRAKSFATKFVGAFRSIPNGIKSILNKIIDAFNGMIRGLNRFRISIPDWVPGLGGKSFSINIPTIPALAKGGNIERSGRVLVGEAGPEILDLPRGARVTPLDHPSVSGTEEKQITINISGNTFRDRSDIDYLVSELNRVKI